MKITKISNNKNKLINLKLLKTKLYRKDNNCYDNFIIDSTTYRLKKALHIIYKFHIANKKILFIGTPIKINKDIERLFKYTCHSIIPESIWKNGIITNRKFYIKYLIKSYFYNYHSKILLKLKEKNDLVVILNECSNFKILKEIAKTETPIISFNNTMKLMNNSATSYKILGNFNFTYKKNRDNFFYEILKAVIRKPKKLKKIHRKPVIKTPR